VYSVAMVLVLLLKQLSEGLDKKKTSYPGPRTVELTSKTSTIATLYSRPPDDGLQMGPKHVEAW
jgi:hypothetical protein